MVGSLLEELAFSLRHPRVRWCLGILLVMTVVILMMVAYGWPVWRSTQQLQAEIENRRHALVNANFSAQLTAAAQRAALQIENIEKRVDASLTQVALVQHLSALAKLHKVKILSETYEEGKPRDGYTPLVHELTLQADYASLRGFLLGLPQLPTVTMVQEATLERPSTSLLIKAHVRMVTYSRARGQH